MPIGCFVNAIGVVLGGLCGAWLGKYLPERVKECLPHMVGMSSLLIGVALMAKVHSLPATILALLLGAVVGELLCLETRIDKRVRAAQSRIMRGSNMTAEQMDNFLTALVLFCASGTGIFGALNEGLTGDSSILIAKTLLDFPTAATFAISLGVIISAIAIPQIIFFLILFFSAGLIVPLMTEPMMNDFRAVGGVLSVIATFRILQIKQIRLTNTLPSLIFAPILSAFFS